MEQERRPTKPTVVAKSFCQPDNPPFFALISAKVEQGTSWPRRMTQVDWKYSCFFLCAYSWQFQSVELWQITLEESSRLPISASTFFRPHLPRS
jgi:hypothetical protein